MDYFQGVVAEYLRADRAVFVNSECLIQLDAGAALPKSRHWYCDMVAVNFRETKVYLCEISYSSTMYALLTRLRAWETHWPTLAAAVSRDCGIPSTWKVEPWLFIPAARHLELNSKLATFIKTDGEAHFMPAPRVTHLEDVTPWKYPSWNRQSDSIANCP